MAKSSGLGDRLYVGGYDLSGDVGAVDTIRGSHSLATVTGIDKSAVERLGVNRDGELAFSAWWDTTAGQAHPVLSALPTADVVAEFHRGAVFGVAAAGLVGKQIDYGINVPIDGAVAASVQVLANGYGLEWGYSLTNANQTFASGTNYGSDCDDLAGSPVSTAFGACLYVQLFSIGGGNVVISAVHGAAAAPTTAIAGCTTTALTGPGAYRFPSTNPTDTILRYTRLKVVSSTNSCVIAAMLVRYRAAIS